LRLPDPAPGRALYDRTRPGGWTRMGGMVPPESFARLAQQPISILLAA